MKRKFIMMPVLIQGPKHPGNDIDVYLRPLVDELLQLWAEPGVRVWDEHKQEEFDLRALLFVIINDWPALSNILGQSNKGYNACTHYLDETESISLDKCRKNAYPYNHHFPSAQASLKEKMQAFQWQGRKPVQSSQGERCTQTLPTKSSMYLLVGVVSRSWEVGTEVGDRCPCCHR
jgi:hypothetical protein